MRGSKLLWEWEHFVHRDASGQWAPGSVSSVEWCSRPRRGFERELAGTAVRVEQAGLAKVWIVGGTGDNEAPQLTGTLRTTWGAASI